jgi:hypothetical protein
MTKPQHSEFHPFYLGYIQNVPEGNFLQLLKENSLEVNSFFNDVKKEKQDFRYQPGKWTIRQIIMHLSDTERVMSYRALTIARGDVNATLSQMDENTFATHANVAGRTIQDLVNEFLVVREATSFTVRLYDRRTICIQRKCAGSCHYASCAGIHYYRACPYII